MPETTPNKKRFNPWPIGLVAWFVFFIGLCVWFVSRSFGMRHDLVSKDYYVEGLHHDEHRLALSRTKALDNPPRIKVDYEKHRLIVWLPDFARDAILVLYRPSDARLDRKYQLQNGVPSVLSTLDLHPGRWEARISWKTNGNDYLFEELVDVH